MVNVKIENEFRYINFLENESEHKLLELSDTVNLSEKELDELPFDMNNRYSRFFDIQISETSDGTFFAVFEVGGCFCEEQYVLELNEFPSFGNCENIKELIDSIEKFGTVNRLKIILNKIKTELDVKSQKINLFIDQELREDAISELRYSIDMAIESEIKKFKNKSDLPSDIILKICNKVKKEYL